jgi:hypothetical protein
VTQPVEVVVTRPARWSPLAGRLPALVVVGLAAVVTSVGLTRQDVMFDEIYYVNDARDVLEHGVEQRFVVHPTLAIRLIAGSIALFGDVPLGWRAPAALPIRSATPPPTPTSSSPCSRPALAPRATTSASPPARGSTSSTSTAPTAAGG